MDECNRVGCSSCMDLEGRRVQVKHRCAATGENGRGEYMVMSGVE